MSEHHENDPMVHIPDAANPEEAVFWKESLEQEGIPCKLVGDIFETGFPLSGVLITPPEVWVRQSDLERATAILDTLPKAKPHTGEEGEMDEEQQDEQA